MSRSVLTAAGVSPIAGAYPPPRVIMACHEPAPLDLVTPLGQQIDWLDVLRSDPDRYVQLWRRLVDEVGGTAHVEYQRSGREFIVGARFDKMRERWDRVRALLAHADEHGLRGWIMAALERDGQVADRRAGDLRALALAIKYFLHFGGRLWIDEDDNLREGSLPGEWMRTGPAALRAENVVRGWLTIRRLPNMESWAKRFVRMAGRRRHGFPVLEARS